MLWNYSYETGVMEIDKQNFDLISRLDAMTNPDTKKGKFEQLVNFELIVPKYFEYEQTMHFECDFFEADMHRYTHEIYLRHLRRIKHNFIENGPTLENEMIFLKNAVEYLKKHIVNQDKLFAEFYKKNIINAKAQ